MQQSVISAPNSPVSRDRRQLAECESAASHFCGVRSAVIMLLPAMRLCCDPPKGSATHAIQTLQNTHARQTISATHLHTHMYAALSNLQPPTPLSAACAACKMDDATTTQAMSASEIVDSEYEVIDGTSIRRAGGGGGRAGGRQTGHTCG